MAPPNYIRFDCKHLRRKGKYSLATLDAAQRRILERKLRDYEKHTKESFEKSTGVGLHQIDFKQWKKAPSEKQQRQVREEISVDIPKPQPVMRFRVSGKIRILGYMDESIFFIVWLDPNHEMGG